MGNSSPVYDAIKNIESLFELDDQICVFSYQNQEHFNGLWNLLTSSPPQFNLLPGTFVIVWDGIPARGSKNDVVDTNKYLTPVDWAVGFSLFINNQCKDAYPDFKILIVSVDPYSKDVNNLRHSLVFTPWIRLLMSNTVDSLICCLLNSDSQSMQEVFSNNKGDMAFIRNLWTARLTRPSTPGDHHALANIIGPVLLMGDDGSDTHITALRHFMVALDLIPVNKEACTLLTKDNPWIKWDELNLGDVLKEPSSNLELILIDDQYEQGWGKMLCLAAGTEYKVPDVTINGLQSISHENNKVTALSASSSDWMLDKLKGDQRFSLVLDDQNTDRKNPEILFLDLRLFSGKDISEEVTFFGKLIPLARKLTEKANNNLPWPGFSEDEIDLVEEWCLCKDKKREDDIYVTALTFLPRIVALTDLSLPIILFSSTGRRDIAEKLKPYGNIITAFDKPKFTVDIPFDIVEQTKGKFQEAVSKALSILLGRNTCIKAKDLNERALSYLGTAPLIPFNSRIPLISHIEIYLDESGTAGSEPFSIGGLIVAYPDYASVSSLQRELIANGIYWNTAFGNNPLLKRMDDVTAEAVVTKFHDACEKLDLFVAAVRVTEPLIDYYENPNKRHFPAKDTASDSIYVRTLSNLLELGIFEWLPQWINKEVTLSIFPGTRTLDINIQGALKSGETATDYYGFGRHGSGRYYVISDNSFVPIVANLLNSRSDISDYITIHHARGVLYAYDSYRLTWGDIRVQSYFADVLLNKPSLFEEQFKNGFDETSDADLYNLLEAQRAILYDNTSFAIRNLLPCDNVNGKMHSQLIKEIVAKLDHIEGYIFLDICQKPASVILGGSANDETRPIIQFVQRKTNLYTGAVTLEFKLYGSTFQKVIVLCNEMWKAGSNPWRLLKNDYFYADLRQQGSLMLGTNLKKVRRE